MTTHRVLNVLSVFVVFGVLLLSGCANYLQPQIGAIARPEARIELAANGVQDASWITKDLDLTYSYSETGDNVSLLGKITFDRSFTSSFPLIYKFILKMSFLDGEGRVLDTVDITPLYKYLGSVSDLKLPINALCVKPVGSISITFNYFGVLRGRDYDVNESWEISYFPFE